jgi:hypothetical protein
MSRREAMLKVRAAARGRRQGGVTRQTHLLRKQLYAKVMDPRVTPGTKCPGARVTSLVGAGALNQIDRIPL